MARVPVRLAHAILSLALLPLAAGCSAPAPGTPAAAPAAQVALEAQSSGTTALL